MENKIELNIENKEIKNKDIEQEKEKNQNEEKTSAKQLNKDKTNVNGKLNEEKSREKDEKSKTSLIKNYSLSPKLFSFPYISDYECIICGLIPSPETAFEKIENGKLICEECLKNTPEEKKDTPKNEEDKKKYRKIKDENKVFYKLFKNLKLKCPNKCEWEGTQCDLNNHLNICIYGSRYCKYITIGCQFFGENKRVIEHEKDNDKLHLELAMKYIKINNITKKNLQFKLGEKCMTSVHPHEMTYMHSWNWNCDGRSLPKGCYSASFSFNRSKARFRCVQCDFDLCDKCIVKYLINK